MTHYNFSVILGFALLMFGCAGGDDLPVNPPVDPDEAGKPATAKTVTFTTDVFTRSVVTELGESSEMNVYVKEYKTLGAEDFVKGTLRSINKGGVWYITPEVKLQKDQKVFLYAIYPYGTEHTDPMAIPVDASKQIDYLYSGDGILASHNSPKPKLTMHHALSVLAFNVCKSTYSGEGKLQSFQLKGEKFATNGVLDIEKGTISGKKDGKLDVKCNMQIKEEGWTENLPQTFSLPTESNGSNITLTMTIDGKEYTVYLPVIKIEKGNKYVFHMGLTDRGLTLFVDATEVISLKQETDKMSVEGGVSSLQFRYAGKTLILPNITGKSLRPGFVDWGDKSSNGVYKLGLTHNYLDAVSHDVVVENWNVEEVIFSSMKGIDAVDFTGF